MSIKICALGLYSCHILKIVLNMIFLKQGKLGLKITKPIMREYKRAESGSSNGILMNERKTKKMLKLYMRTRRNTIIALVAILVGGIIGNVMLGHISD